MRPPTNDSDFVSNAVNIISFVSLVVAFAVGTSRLGNTTWMRAPPLSVLYIAVYALIIKTRRKAAQLSPAELSKFLCNTVLLGGVGAMAPMIFFTFESLSCIVSNGLENDQCNNATVAAMFLSIYLVIIT